MRRAVLGLCAMCTLSACAEQPPRKDEPIAPAEASIATDGGTASSESNGALSETLTDGRASHFTELTEAGCKLVETIEETGDWTRSCPDVAGYAIRWSSGDLREDLVLRRSGRERPLQIPTIVANGAFDRIGKIAEWRGPARSAPDVLVLRVHVAGSDGRDDSGRLAIARLGSSPCLVAIIPPGPGQSDRARRIADAPLPDCVKR